MDFLIAGRVQPFLGSFKAFMTDLIISAVGGCEEVDSFLALEGEVIFKLGFG